MSTLEEVLDEIKSIHEELAEAKKKEGYSINDPGVVALNQRLAALTAERASLRSSLTGATPAGGATEPDLTAEVQKVLDCTVILKSSGGARGNGIVVTRNKLLTALHGYFHEGDLFDIIDRHGISRKGFVKRAWYSENVVDMAVIELNEGYKDFENQMAVNTTPVSLGTNIWVICRRPISGPDEYSDCLLKYHVSVVVDNTSLFHSAYYSEDGMSGCGVVASFVGNTFKVVGVHVASHDRTVAVDVEQEEEVRPSKKQKTKHVKEKGVSREEFDNAMLTINSNIHGHGAYSIICDVARVEGLFEALGDLLR